MPTSLADFYGRTQRTQRTPTQRTQRPTSMAPQGPRPQGPTPAQLGVRARVPVAVVLPQPLSDLLETAERVGDIGDQAGELLGRVGLVAVVGLAAYGGWKWYKGSQRREARRPPQSRRVKATLLPKGAK